MAKSWRDDEDIVRRVQNRDYSSGADAILMDDEDYGATLYDQSIYNTMDAAGKAALHDRTEQRRAKYNYSGGKHGDEYIKLNQPVRTDSTEHLVSDVMQRMANYDQLLASDPYQPGLDAAYQAIRDRKPFEYDLESDPAWQAYRKQYTREGRRASEDVLGQYAAMTGGMPSTAAMTAAQQAGDYYAAQMTDKIPELYRLAYSMYADDANRQLADLNAIRGLSGDWYGRQQDAYGRLGDLYSAASRERSYADAQAQQAAEDAYKYAMATGDYSYLRDLGYDTSYLEKQRNKDMAELDKPLLSLSEVNAAIKAGNTAPNVLKAWEYYYGAPYSGPTGGYGGGGGGNYTLKGDDVSLPPVGSTIDLSTDVGKKVAAIPGAIGDYLSRWDDMDAETRYMALVTSGVDTGDALRISGSGDRWQAQMALESIQTAQETPIGEDVKAGDTFMSESEWKDNKMGFDTYDEYVQYFMAWLNS
ncbi:MAG: hypothetical protein J6S60_07315 [Oscillospiraceae bacterium]|nr:hypothetical protein [Oscillospiraceae bacterium]